MSVMTHELAANSSGMKTCAGLPVLHPNPALAVAGKSAPAWGMGAGDGGAVWSQGGGILGQ